MRPVRHPVEEMIDSLQDAKTRLSALLQDPEPVSPLENPQSRDLEGVLWDALEATEPAYSTHPFVWPHLMAPKLRALQQAASSLSRAARHGSGAAPSPEKLALARSLLQACAGILRTWPHRGRMKARRTAKRLDRLVSGASSPDSVAAAAEAAGRLLLKQLPAIGQSRLEPVPDSGAAFLHSATQSPGPLPRVSSHGVSSRNAAKHLLTRPLGAEGAKLGEDTLFKSEAKSEASAPPSAWGAAHPNRSGV